MECSYCSKDFPSYEALGAHIKRWHQAEFSALLALIAKGSL